MPLMVSCKSLVNLNIIPWWLRERALSKEFLVKNPPAITETRVQTLGWEDPLEKGTVTHSSILVWIMDYSPWDLEELDRTEQLSLSALPRA